MPSLFKVRGFVELFREGNPGGVHEVAKWVLFLGENLNLTASFNHQRAAKIVIPLVVKNLMSDSDFPPKMVPIFSRYETTYCCLLVPCSPLLVWTDSLRSKVLAPVVIWDRLLCCVRIINVRVDKSYCWKPCWCLSCWFWWEKCATRISYWIFLEGVRMLLTRY